jgi:hypothetical protein
VSSPPPEVVLIGMNYPVVASGATAVYTAKIVDVNGNPLPATDVNTLTLSLVDTSSGSIINDVSAVDILNVGRGTLDDAGNLTITLGQGANQADTVSLGPTLSTRSMVIDWSYGMGNFGRHQVNFQIFLPVGP